MKQNLQLQTGNNKSMKIYQLFYFSLNFHSMFLLFFFYLFFQLNFLPEIEWSLNRQIKFQKKFYRVHHSFILYFLKIRLQINWQDIQMNPKYCVLLLLLLINQVKNECGSFIDTSLNFAINGDFQSPQIGAVDYIYTTTQIQGWTARVIQLGKGTFYNPNWGSNNQVIELDTDQNQFYNKTITLPQTQTFYFQISYAARVFLPLTTSGMELWWNGQLFRTVNPSIDYLVHTENFTLQALAGDNLLGVKGAGTSDVVGMTVDNIIFYKMFSDNRQTINGLCSCKQGFYNENSSSICKLCWDKNQGCESCDESSCYACDLSQLYFLDNSTQKCSLCNNSQTKYIDQNSGQCVECTSCKNLMSFIFYSSYAILFVSLFSAKIVGLELFGVLQLAYFNLADNKLVNLYLTPMLKWRIINGFNLAIDSSTTVPSNVYSIQYKGSFISNINVMLAVVIFQLLVSIILYLISKRIVSLQKVARFLLQEFFVGVFLFNSFNIAFSVGLHFKYSTAQNDENYILSTIAAVVGLLFYLIAILMLKLAQKKHFGEFKQKFKSDCVNQSYIEVSIIYRFCLGWYMATSNEEALGTLLILGFSLAYIMFNIINLPFAQPYQNYRANICHITQLIILFVSNYYQSMKYYVEASKKLKMYNPAIIEIVLITICVCVSIVSLTYEIYKTIKLKLKQKTKKKKSVLPENSQQTFTNEDMQTNPNQLQQNKVVKIVVEQI